MSREEAHRRTGAGRAREPTERPAAPPTPEEAVRPRSPLFTARTDLVAGVIRARGHLDPVGADALCRVVSGLRQQGHRQIALLLGTATVTGDARALLADHARRLRGDGVDLLLG